MSEVRTSRAELEEVLATSRTILAQLELEAEERLRHQRAGERVSGSRPAHGGAIGEMDPCTPLRALTARSPMADVETALRHVLAALDGADILRRRTIRTEAVRVLDAIEIRGAAGLVDAALATIDRSDELPGTELVLDDPEPWPSPVDGAELLDELSALYGRYLVLPAGGADVLALWTAHTYAIDAWEHTGYIALASATRRCGKTTTLRLIEALASRAMRADCISAAALYRIVEEWCPTLLLDELDRMHPDSDVWPVLLSGHTRGATVPRCVGDDHEPRLYRTYGARAISYIRGGRCPVPAALEDRAITIQMSRRRSSEPRARLRSRVLRAEAEPLRRRVVRWTGDHRAELEVAEPEIPDALDDRAADSWEPMLVIADLAGGGWPGRARELAVTYSATRTEDEREAPSVMVLVDVAELLADGGLVGEYLAADDVCRVLRALPERPWRSWGRDGQGLHPTSLSRLLRPHGIRTVQTGPAASRVRRYSAGAIVEAAARYVEDGTHPSGERVRSTRSPAHADSGQGLSHRQYGAERVSGSEPLGGGDLRTEDTPAPLTQHLQGWEPLT